MSATQTYEFGEYLLRPATERDMHLAVTWTAADADHRDRTRPEFWLEQKIGSDSYMLEDRAGELFFFKIQRISLKAAYLHVQFPPPHDGGARTRIAKGLLHGFSWLESQLKKSKIDTLYFTSTNYPLRAFAERRLGFHIFSRDQLAKVIGS